MQSLTFRCPRTGLRFHSGIQMDRRTLATIQPVKLTLSCRCCAQTHQFPINDAQLADAEYGYRDAVPLTQQVLSDY
jgi:hypothetical protein